MNHFFHDIKGWATLQDQGELIKYLLTNFNKDKNIKLAEIGVYMGRGAAIWNVELINHGFEYEYYAIDNFLGSKEHEENNLPDYDICKNNLSPIIDKINLIKEDSIEASKLYEDEYFNIVYIDASHEYEDVKKDVQSWYPKVKKGGFICGDDYTRGWPGVVKAVDELLGEGVKVIGNQQWWIKK
jgi:hypothetical protein